MVYLLLEGLPTITERDNYVLFYSVLNLHRSPSSLKQHMESAHSPEIFFCHPCQIPFRGAYLFSTLKGQADERLNFDGGILYH